MVKFGEEKIIKEKREGYDFVKIRECGMTSIVGNPMLPKFAKGILIPPGAVVTRVEVVFTKCKMLDGEFQIYPTQPPQPFIKGKKLSFTPPNQEIYSQNKYLPEKIVNCDHTGNLSGYRIASVEIYPLQYNPVQRKLKLYEEIRFKLEIKEGEPQYVRKKHKEYFKKMVKKIVLNPEKVEIYSPPELTTYSSTSLPPDTIEYVIITSPSFAPYFAPFVEWKSKKGIPTKVVTTDFIYANFPGQDKQEKIRSFLKEAKDSWGTLWVLLGGDETIVPTRKIWMFDISFMQPNYDTISCDWYYSDLDDNWNRDEDEVYGEIEDSVDFYGDIWVGRAPFSVECTTFITKTLLYEKNPPPNYLEKMLLVAENLWPGYPGDWVNEEIAKITPPTYYIAKLSQQLENVSDKAVLDSIEAGYHFIHHAAHGSPDQISTGVSTIEVSELLNLKNKPFFPIYIAISCLPGAFDFSKLSYGEAWMNNPEGGGVVCCFNTRYGWGTLDYPGRSEWLDIKFFELLFKESCYNIGEILGRAKNSFVPYHQEDRIVAWCLATLTLFGDPELPIWTKKPKKLEVKYQNKIEMTEEKVKVITLDEGTPVEGVRVCIRKEGEIYRVKNTDEKGEVVFNLSIKTPGKLEITAVKHNFLPYEGECSVISSSPFIVFKEKKITTEDGDEKITGGEEVRIKVVAQNVGGEEAEEVRGVLSSVDSFLLQIEDSIQEFGSLPVGESIESKGEYRVMFSPTTPAYHEGWCKLQFVDKKGNEWVDSFNLLVYAPKFEYLTHYIKEGKWLPGEEVGLKIRIKNVGNWESDSTYGELFTSNSQVKVVVSTGEFGKILPEESGENSNEFRIKANERILIGENVEFGLKIKGYIKRRLCYEDTIKFYVRIGGEGSIYGDHNVGNVVFTVTSQGVCGFVEEGGEGRGFIYPKEGKNHLFIGSLWIGGIGDYVINRDYKKDKKDWQVSTFPDGRLLIGGQQISDQDGIAIYEDTSSTVRVTQRTIAFKDDSYNDFVIIKYEIENISTQPLNDVYVGQFMDFDIEGEVINRVNFNEKHKLVYQSSTLGSIFCGVKMVSKGRVSNLSGISMEKYLYPNFYIKDSVKLKLLRGELSNRAPEEEKDWGVIISSGPFKLYVGEKIEVGFAILGGKSVDEIIYNGERAQEKYKMISKGVKAQENLFPLSYKFEKCVPTPFSQFVSLFYTIPERSWVSIKIYNVAGRVVKVLENKTLKPGRYKIVWNGRDEKGEKVRSGIYFCEIKTKKWKEVKKLMLIKR